MDNKEAEDNKHVLDFMREHPCATLATHGKEGRINLANVFAFVDDNYFLYVVSRPDHRKHQNVVEHPQVSLMFTDQEGVQQAECIGVGKTVERIETLADMLPNLQKILIEHKSEYWVPPVAQLEADGYVVIKIVPELMVYRTYAQDGVSSKPNEVVVNFDSTIE